MLPRCLLERLRMAGCTLAAATAAAELAAMAYYLRCYSEYLRTHPEPGSSVPSPPDSISGEVAGAFVAVVSDPPALIGVTVTFVSVLLCNILLFYGVWRRKLLCFLPWLLLHAALFLEALLAAGFCIVKSIITWSFYGPLAGTLLVALFIVVVWLLVKDIFLALYFGEGSYPPSQEERYFYTNGGSDYSRDHLELHSFAHSSPRVSYVTAMADRVNI